MRSSESTNECRSRRRWFVRSGQTLKKGVQSGGNSSVVAVSHLCETGSSMLLMMLPLVLVVVMLSTTGLPGWSRFLRSTNHYRTGALGVFRTTVRGPCRGSTSMSEVARDS